MSPVSNFNIGFSGIYGAQEENQGEKLRVIDIDLTYNVTERLLFGGEINIGSEDINGSTADWSGFLAMFHYDFNDRIGLTGRFDYFDDTNGSRTGTAQKLNAFTIAPTFVLGDGFGGLFEIRIDNSDRESFIGSDDIPTKQNITAAFELTFSF